MKQSQITYWCHEIIRSQVLPGGCYIDATMGNGHDTLFLKQLAGTKGKVLAFDIQKQAADHTKQLLLDNGYDVEDPANNISLILTSHVNMDQHVEEKSVDLICFNFGYLPGADHSLATKAESSVEAIKRGLPLLKRGGMMSLMIYSGGDTGYEEKEAILSLLKELPPKQYTVILNQYYNRKNDPPIPVFIFAS